MSLAAKRDAEFAIMPLRRAAPTNWRAAARRWFGSSADAVVIGAGVVGLAAARALAMAGREVLVLEASSSFGTGTSSRSSEVIHAGIYYPPESLKVGVVPRCCFQNQIFV